ncbi:MAG: MtrB/PioB family decaheme-associated outer membrane protein [Candidatus Aminicenantales bacterium]
MKKLIPIIIVLVFIAGKSSILAKNEEEIKIDGKALVGASVVNQDRESSKFFEYRAVPEGFSFSLFDISAEKAGLYLNFSATRVRQDDERYNISLGRYGRFNVYFEWDKIPHRFSFEGKTLYLEPQPGVLSLSDQIQKNLQDTIGDSGRNLTQGMDILSGYLTGSHEIGLELIRRKGILGLDYDLSAPIQFNLKLQEEKKEGNRAIGAPLGFGNVMEVPEPVDHTTKQIEAKLSYSKEWINLNAGYSASIFENNIIRLQWDNPYRLTDQIQPFPLADLIGNGSATGQLSLPPSSSAQKLFLNGTFRILKSTRLNTSLSYGVFSQDEKLLPYTVNTGLEQFYSNALNPPRETAHAKAGIGSMNFTLNSRITKQVILNAGYKYYEFNNKTEELSIPGYSRLDQVWVAAPFILEPLGYTHSSLYGDLTISIIRNTSFKIGYYSKTVERTRGSEDNGKNTDDTFSISLNASPLSWAVFRGSYIMSKRDWSLEGKKDIYLLREPGSFNFRRYHEAERDRDGVNLFIMISPFGNFQLSATYLLAKDEYKKSEYGLLSNDFYSYSFDLSYAFNNHSLYGFYSREKYTGFQAARKTSLPPYDRISLNPLDDWTAGLTDTFNTFGGGINLNLNKDKLNLDLSYIYSEAEGASDLSTPSGGNPASALDFEKGMDSTTLHAAKARLIWKLSPHISLILGHWYEQYRLEDITRNDLQVDLLRKGFAFYLGALEPDYRYHVSFLQIYYSW